MGGMKDKGKSYGHVMKGTNWDLDDEVTPKVPKQPVKKEPISRTKKGPLCTPISRTKRVHAKKGTPGIMPKVFHPYNE